MIEVIHSYDLLPGVDQQAYAAWAKKAIGIALQQKGLVELRANRNLLCSPQARTVSVWQSISDWAQFNEGAWAPLEHELRTFATHFKVEVWGPSPLMPETLRPKS